MTTIAIQSATLIYFWLYITQNASPVVVVPRGDVQLYILSFWTIDIVKLFPNWGKASLFLDEIILLHPYFCVLHPRTWMYSFIVEKMLSILLISIWKNQKKPHTMGYNTLLVLRDTQKTRKSRTLLFPKVH